MASSSVSPSSVIVSYVSLAFVFMILFLICQNNLSLLVYRLGHVFFLLFNSGCMFSGLWFSLGLYVGWLIAGHFLVCFYLVSVSLFVWIPCVY